jgi:hypothetical protein
VGSRRVTLTFDNGPTPGVTERVLEILDRENIRSTFFVIGQNLGSPAATSLARDARSAGHWIGNHTFTHSVALGDRPTADYAAREIGDTQDRIGDLSHPHKLFRPRGNGGLIGSHLLSRAGHEAPGPRILKTGNARLWSTDGNPLMAFTFLRGCLLRAR